MVQRRLIQRGMQPTGWEAHNLPTYAPGDYTASTPRNDSLFRHQVNWKLPSLRYARMLVVLSRHIPGLMRSYVTARGFSFPLQCPMAKLTVATISSSTMGFPPRSTISTASLSSHRSSFHDRSPMLQLHGHTYEGDDAVPLWPPSRMTPTHPPSTALFIIVNERSNSLSGLDNPPFGRAISRMTEVGSGGARSQRGGGDKVAWRRSISEIGHARCGKARNDLAGDRTPKAGEPAREVMGPDLMYLLCG